MDTRPYKETGGKRVKKSIEDIYADMGEGFGEIAIAVSGEISRVEGLLEELREKIKSNHARQSVILGRLRRLEKEAEERRG